MQERPVAVFNVCLNAADPAKRQDVLGYNKAATASVTPVAQESFAGRYVPERVNWWRRMFMRTLVKPAQDHVDPTAIRAWAAELATLFVEATRVHG